jgi:hypothetical protein
MFDVPLCSRSACSPGQLRLMAASHRRDGSRRRPRRPGRSAGSRPDPGRSDSTLDSTKPRSKASRNLAIGSEGSQRNRNAVAWIEQLSSRATAVRPSGSDLPAGAQVVVAGAVIVVAEPQGAGRGWVLPVRGAAGAGTTGAGACRTPAAAGGRRCRVSSAAIRGGRRRAGGGAGPCSHPRQY